MYKYQFIVCSQAMETKTKTHDGLESVEHNIFKGIFDSFEEGMDFIYDKYKLIMDRNHIPLKDLHEHVFINKIDTVKCPNWKNIFLGVSPKPSLSLT